MACKNIPLRIRLAAEKTIPELEEMIYRIESHPDSKIGALSPRIFNKATLKKLDEISWAIYSISKKLKPEYVRKAPSAELKNW